MLTRRLGLVELPRRELALCAAAAGATALIALLGVHKLGTAGLLAPLALVAVLILLIRPVFAVSLVVVVVTLVEGPTFGIFASASRIYETGFKDVSLVDMMVMVAVAAVGLDLVRKQRRLYVPRPLAVPLVCLALAMVAGAVVGHAAGTSLRFAITSEHVLAYLLLLPLAVVNLDVDRAQVTRLLGGALVLACVKAGLGLLEVVGHLGSPIEGVATLTYYEPTANWVVMIALLTLVAALLARERLRWWALAMIPLLTASLVLSYRRSFWIGAVLALMLMLMLATTPVGRRMLVPTALAIAAAVWLVGSIHFQDQIPIVKRAATLTPSKIEGSAEDRYRLNERANVWAAIEANPITGLGAAIPWKADVQTLSLETGGEGREYVHFAALWFWLKLGILGLFAYVGMMLASMWISVQAWRASHEPLLKAFGVASLCGLVGLIVIDTTASFTGVDPRFTIVLAAQVGLLARLVLTADEQDSDEDEVSALMPPPLEPTVPAAR
jgi:O-antigen ligase